MGEFFKIADTSELINGHSKTVSIQGIEIVIIKTRDQIFIIDNLCPHQHAPVMGESSIESNKITCPLHGWTFDLVTGRSQNGEGRLKKYNFKIKDRDIFVEI